MLRSTSALLATLSLLSLGCDDASGSPDSGGVDAGGRDGSLPSMDAGPRLDAGRDDAAMADAAAPDAALDGGPEARGCLVTAAPGSGATYYAAPGGSADNPGTEASPFSLEHAFATAAAGDTVHVLAGDYGAVNLVADSAGTAAEPIRFVGYRSAPGDIEAVDGATHSFGDAWDASEMPTLTGTWAEQEGVGTGINLRGSYIQLENFQVQHYESGLRIDGDHNCARNVATLETGDYNPLHTYPDPEPNAFVNYSGNGIVVGGEAHELRDSIVIDSGAQGVTLNGCDGCVADGVEVHAARTENPTDYYFLIGTDSSGNTATNITVHRHGALQHGGHGICFKGTGAIEDNVVDGFTIRNTNLELQFPGVARNTARNGRIVLESESAFLNDTIGINLANGAHENRFENIYTRGGGVYFRDWDDGLGGDVDDSGDGNVFVNLVVDSPRFAISFHFFGSGNFDSSADDNTFYHCTFHGGGWLFENSRANSNTRFVNCVFDEMAQRTVERAGSPGYPLDVSFENCNFSGLGFATPSGTNITEHAPDFVDPESHDFSLRPTSPLIDLGAASEVSADFDGVSRPQGAAPDLGAYESAE